MNTILFDLDGTLINSFEGIYSCYIKSLEESETKPVGRGEFRIKIGASFDKMVSKIHPEISDQKMIAHIVKVFRSHYDEHGYKQYDVFENIYNIFELIDRYNWEAGIVSNKKDSQVKEIIFKEFSAFQIGCYGRIGQDWSKVEKVKELGADYNIVAFVGDSQEDYNCAKAIAKVFIFASYGYGEIEDYKYCENCKTTIELYESIERTILSNQMEF